MPKTDIGQNNTAFVKKIANSDKPYYFVMQKKKKNNRMDHY